MEKKDVFRHLADLARAHDCVAVATVVRTYGSTPREAGARMVIQPDGTFQGTVGGGCGEAEVWQEARRVLRRDEAALVRVDLTEDPETGGEAVCGGRMDVFVDVWRKADMQAAGEVVRCLDRGEGVCLATVVEADPDAAPLPCPSGARLFVRADGTFEGTLGSPELDTRVASRARQVLSSRRSCMASVPLGPDDEALVPAPRTRASGTHHVFLEVVEQPPVLVIVGAGHCALPLARIARMLGFRLVILDDRPECATRERFPDADQFLVGDLEAQAARLPLDAHTYVVLVTRGHKLDEVILRRIIRQPVAYIGMIGSRRRVGTVLAAMERDGFERELLDRVYSPIGLDIGADTPEEIAISILGEIVMVRKGGTGVPLSALARKVR